MMSTPQNQTKLTILVIGLGHLGQFFEQECPASVEIDATYRRHRPCGKNLKDIHQLNMVENDEGLFNLFVNKTYHCVVWMLPPIKNYVHVLAQAHNFFNNSTAWIFVSSTSVYGHGDITEQSAREGSSDNAQILIQCEQFLNSIARPCTIVRPSGLFDDIRNPANFFKDKASIPNASTPVNLVHTRDVARFLWHVIGRQLWGDQFNLACHDHPLKKDFYAPLIFKKYGKVIGIDDVSNGHKIISNLKSLQCGFEYSYPLLAKYVASH